MKIEHALEPTEAQLNAILATGKSGEVHMLNLLKFREFAAYEDGRDADMPGRDAYLHRYGAPMVEMVMKAGGSLKFSSVPSALLVGEVEMPWDMVAIITYPSIKTLIDISMTPQFQEIAVHRKAGLEGQLLIPCFGEDTAIA
ncbi:hypothetical protein [Maricaulis sp.]|uniref:hypothetical protein n=1 Tax=unclassified Maricaulis TaxID=2632371 RepID=UPI001B15822F|nr:hypothetical protein [Maricaulis sp.]MBO6795562.1 DUF1330 domain-containing protein [Maricaulis sp.]